MAIVTGTFTPWSAVLSAGAAAASGALTAWAWGAPVPDPAAHRVFLGVWCTAALALAALGSGRAPRALGVFALGGLVGAALGSTPWQSLDAVFWYQLWWTVPVASGLAAAVRSARRGRAGES
ncbi:hypothetical protein [Nocardiopsis baichengensis]|uniref:hypothetical protein n=1 Tax=Nocardiopsis baichengensis TaxID=280240 RepID=UPI00038034D5|nr:hypothetical protein [Nocardiopsis baichengensis]